MQLNVMQNPKPEASSGESTGLEKKIGKIEVDRELCIGAESCVVVAPDAFEMDEESIAVVKDGALLTDDQTILEAAQACPVAAVLLYDEEGNQIYP